MNFAVSFPNFDMNTVIGRKYGNQRYRPVKCLSTTSNMHFYDISRYGSKTVISRKTMGNYTAINKGMYLVNMMCKWGEMWNFPGTRYAVFVYEIWVEIPDDKILKTSDTQKPECVHRKPWRPLQLYYLLITPFKLYQNWNFNKWFFFK